MHLNTDISWLLAIVELKETTVVFGSAWKPYAFPYTYSVKCIFMPQHDAKFPEDDSFKAHRQNDRTQSVSAILLNG